MHPPPAGDWCCPRAPEYATLDMQVAIRRHAEEARRAHGINPKIRVGLNSGEVAVRAIGSDLHMDYTAVGQTRHLAARMEQFAGPGVSVVTADPGLSIASRGSGSSGPSDHDGRNTPNVKEVIRDPSWAWGDLLHTR